MKRILVFLFVPLVMTGCYLYREAPIVWYWENEMYESLGVLDNYCVYDYSVPFKGIMESYESVPAHYQILLPPRKEIRNILWGPSEDRCFLFTKNRGIAIIQDLHDWERKYENGLNQITKDMAENQLLKFADLLGKEVKVKGKKEHYMYVDNEIRILMFNLTEEDYFRFVEFPLANLKIRKRGEVRQQDM